MASYNFRASLQKLLWHNILNFFCLLGIDEFRWKCFGELYQIFKGAAPSANITFSLLSTIGNFNPNHAQELAWSCTKSWSGQYCLIQWKLFHMMKDSSYYLKKFFSFHAWAGFKMLIDLVLRRKCFLSYAPLVQASMSVKSNLGHHHEFTEEEAGQIELITFNWICIKFGSLKKY